jgi:hypothetical protein
VVFDVERQVLAHDGEADHSELTLSHLALPYP